jgi:RNA polymerase sigma-70 factor (ECF subfamily)
MKTPNGAEVTGSPSNEGSAASTLRQPDTVTSVEPSEHILARFQAGDAEALNQLWTRYLPRLKRWAHARIPPSGRHLGDTDDMIQDAFVRSLAHMKTFTARGPRTTYAYFKTIILNQIRDVARYVRVRPAREELDAERQVELGPSPLEEAVGRETLELYEQALDGLSEADQDIVRAHVELGLSDAEMAELMDRPSTDAARMARGRALVRLAQKMSELSRGSVRVQTGRSGRSPG